MNASSNFALRSWLLLITFFASMGMVIFVILQELRLWPKRQAWFWLQPRQGLVMFLLLPTWGQTSVLLEFNVLVGSSL